MAASRISPWKAKPGRSERAATPRTAASGPISGLMQAGQAHGGTARSVLIGATPRRQGLPGPAGPVPRAGRAQCCRYGIRPSATPASRHHPRKTSRLSGGPGGLGAPSWTGRDATRRDATPPAATPSPGAIPHLGRGPRRRRVMVMSTAEAVARRVASRSPRAGGRGLRDAVPPTGWHAVIARHYPGRAIGNESERGRDAGRRGRQRPQRCSATPRHATARSRAFDLLPSHRLIVF